MRTLKNLYQRIMKSITVPVLRQSLRFLDDWSWLPIFYFFVPKQNTTGFLLLHTLHNIQVKTGRKIVVVTAWPFWPQETASDSFFTSFLKGLNSNIKYIQISNRLERLIQRFIGQLFRFFQFQGILHRPMSLRSMVRLDRISTLDHMDLANCSFLIDLVNRGARVVFNIPSSHEHMLEERLKNLGVSPDDWFVCVHAREPGYHQEIDGHDPIDGRSSAAEHRNVDIRDYFPAIDYIMSKGGKVVRMGDPSMTRVKGIEGVIDYPFTEHKSMPMDLFLVSRCRFVLGCGSGISTTFTSAFGTPVLVTNEATSPVSTVHLPYDNIIILPKRLLVKESGRILDLREMFHPRIPTRDNAHVFEAAGYGWIPNTPQDILEATKEMLHLVETDSFGGPRTWEQELFHRCRVEALKALWDASERSRDAQWCDLSMAESRISATYAARYFADEAKQADFSYSR